MVWKIIGGAHAMALKKNSPYTPFMTMVMIKLFESGQIHRLITNYNSKTICNPTMNDDGTPLGYQKLFLLFTFTLGAMVLAILVLVYEVLNNKSKPKVQITMEQQPKSKEISTQTSSEDMNYINNPIYPKSKVASPITRIVV